MARLIGGKRHAGSGGGYAKNDAHSAHFLVECKGRLERNQNMISVRRVDLESLVVRAHAQGKVPFLEIQLGGKYYVIIPEDDFLYIHERSLAGEGGMSGSGPGELHPAAGDSPEGD